MMGSMGTVVGEKITRLFEYATVKGLPVVGCTVVGRGAYAGGHSVAHADGKRRAARDAPTATAGFCISSFSPTRQRAA